MAKRKRKDEQKDLFDGSDNEGRAKALEATLTDITKKYGDGAILRLGDARNMVVDTISTGSLTVDIATGVGGLPRGRITEIYGPESSGKTTLCLSVIAQSQKNGGLCAFVDMGARPRPELRRAHRRQPRHAIYITTRYRRTGA